MVYKLQITDKAVQDLDAILGYIMTELCNLEAALHLADEVERHYALLLATPFLYSECQQPLLRNRHDRKVVIDGYLMIYRVSELNSIIYIERFFSDLQDYAAKL
ncbi:MAG: type II toxin-antitoxin system RelE/ParE family toxin [Clostridia bacterium]